MARTSHGPMKTPVYPEDTVSAGDDVRGLRLERGLTLRPAAALAGLQAVDLSKIESGCVRLRSPALAMSYLRDAWARGVKCPKCDGSGSESGPSVPGWACPKCGGAGRVPSRKEATPNT